MNAIRIRRKLESDHPDLPELRSFVGKMIEMVVWEGTTPVVTQGTADWSAAATAAGNLEGYDFDAWRDQRETDLQNSVLHIP